MGGGGVHLETPYQELYRLEMHYQESYRQINPDGMIPLNPEDLEAGGAPMVPVTWYWICAIETRPTSFEKSPSVN
jgi:hypothetical protein